MVSPPGFNNFIVNVNELHQDVQNFKGGNLRNLVKTGINTPRINIS